MKPPPLTPDGYRYLAATNARAARPFHYRWLLPTLLGNHPTRWAWTTRAALCALLPATYVYVGGWQGVAAAAAVVGLPGVWAFNWRFPVLVDAPAMLVALVAADCFRAGWWPAGIALALLGGTIRETSPVFAALYAWNPLALIGLLAPAVRHLQREGPDVLGADHRWILEHPIRASRRAQKDHGPGWWVLPWGVAVIALASWSAQLGVTLGLAYAQCAVATDRVRLYQWAFPVVLASATHAVPPAWLPVFVVVLLVNPHAGPGL